MDLLNSIDTLSTSRIFAFLLALLPALFNVFVLVYAIKKLPRNYLTNLFTLWVIGLLCWQISDLLLKLAGDKDSANLISDLLWLPSVSVAPVGLHFALLFTNQKKILRSPLIYVLLYLPLIFFEVGARAGFILHSRMENEFWGWVLAPTVNIWSRAEISWVAILSIVTFLLLLNYSLKMRRNNLRYMQSLLLTIGYSVPVIQGIITQVIFPYALEVPEWPLTSFSMTFFSVAAYLALTRYELLNFTPEYASEQIIDIMSDGLCVIDKEHKVLLHNQQFCAITGYNSDEVTGNTINDLFHLDEKEYWARPHELPAQYEIILNTRSKRLALLIGETAITNKKGKIIGSLLILTDIKKRIEAENKLKERNNELSTFLYRTSHDLRGPLASVMGITNLLSGSDSPEDTQIYIGLIGKSTAQLDNILKELLLVSVILQQEPEIEKIDVEIDIQLSLNELAHMEEFNSTEIKVNITSENKIHTDRGLLRVIIQNILKNSLKYSKEVDPVIQVDIKDHKNGLRFIIKDNGIGINPKAQSKVMQMFYKGTSLSKGSGLGLFIAKKAVDRLSGTIEIESHEKIGTSVSIYLPDLDHHIAKRSGQDKRIEGSLLV